MRGAAALIAAIISRAIFEWLNPDAPAWAGWLYLQVTFLGLLLDLRIIDMGKK